MASKCIKGSTHYLGDKHGFRRFERRPFVLTSQQIQTKGLRSERRNIRDL